MRRMLSLAAKDLRLLARDKVGFFFTFVFPLVFAVFFGTIFSGGGDSNALPIAVVDEDGTDASKAFVAKLDADDALEVTVVSRDDAVALVRRGKRVAYVVVPAGYGESQRRMFWGEPAEFEIGVDPSRAAEIGMLQGVLMRHAFAGMQTLFTDPAARKAYIDETLKGLEGDPALRERLKPFLEQWDALGEMPPGEGASFEPVRVRTVDVSVQRGGPTSAYAISFPQGIVWGIIGCAAGFGISLVVERTRGTLVRLQTAPLTRMQILGGKAAACFATTVAVSAALLLVARFAFGVRPTSWPLLAAAVICCATAFTGIMMLLSVLGKTEAAAGGIGWAILLVMAMIGGGMVPLFVMPPFMQTLSHASPVKWAVLSLEGAVWRGFGPAEMALPCGILLGVGVACFAIGARWFDWREAA